MNSETVLPESKDLEVVKQELGGNGYYGWLIIRKQEDGKAILKAEIHFLDKEKDEIMHKAVLRFNPDDSFKETYLVGAYYESGFGLVDTIIDKIKDLNILGTANSVMNMASQVQN